MTEPNEERSLATKTFGVLEIKDADKGEVEAVVATLDVVDKDQEVIKSGAIPSGAKVKLSEWGHNSVGMGFGSPQAPVGKGVLTVDGKKVLFRGRFFLNTTRGADAFRTIKEMGPDQEWSFGYRIRGTEVPDDEWRKKGAITILTKLEPFEVSPVSIGAGVGTRTVGVKCDACGQPTEMGRACGGCTEKAAQEAATKAAAEKAAADVQAARQAEEAKQPQVQEALKAAAMEEFERFQRTLRRMGAIGTT